MWICYHTNHVWNYQSSQIPTCEGHCLKSPKKSSHAIMLRRYHYVGSTRLNQRFFVKCAANSRKKNIGDKMENKTQSQPILWMQTPSHSSKISRESASNHSSNRSLHCFTSTLLSSYKDSKVEINIWRNPSGPRLLALCAQGHPGFPSKSYKSGHLWNVGKVPNNPTNSGRARMYIPVTSSG